jgi:hypothetical protein
LRDATVVLGASVPSSAPNKNKFKKFKVNHKFSIEVFYITKI